MGFHGSFGGSAVPADRRAGGQCVQLGWELLMDKPATKTKYENQKLLCRGLMESRHSCEPAWLCWLSWDSQENAWIEVSWKPELVLPGQRGVWGIVSSEFCFLLCRQHFMHLNVG